MVAELEKLASVINGRTVCVLGLGPSLGELDKWIQRFKNKDMEKIKEFVEYYKKSDPNVIRY